jgi:hypothetical protein
MRDGLHALVAVLAVAAAAWAEDRPSLPAPDPAFAKIPFERWLTERDQDGFKWSVRVSGGELANLQRLGARLDIQVDGEELVKRRGAGELVFFVQFSDAAHRLYQSHAAIELRQVTEAAAKSNFVYSQLAFVTPGDYRIAVAILDAGTGEHATAERTLHVSSLRGDPLPGAWQGLPTVEFTTAGDPPDVWFQPNLIGRLHLPLETRRPVRVEVLVNASRVPAAQSRGPRPTAPGLADLLPALNVISGVDLRQGALNVSLLDLTRRQVLFAQDRIDPRNRPLDWNRLRPALLQAEPNKIDVRDLERRRENPQFFVKEIRRRMLAETEADPDSAKSRAGKPGPALIVLSGPVAFEPGDDVHPIERTQGLHGKVFFIRYNPRPARLPLGYTVGGRMRGFPNPRAGLEPIDQLEPLLKPLQPRIFDVYTPEQFRKALAEIMKEIALM